MKKKLFPLINILLLICIAACLPAKKKTVDPEDGRDVRQIAERVKISRMAKEAPAGVERKKIPKMLPGSFQLETEKKYTRRGRKKPGMVDVEEELLPGDLALLSPEYTGQDVKGTDGPTRSYITTRLEVYNRELAKWELAAEEGEKQILQAYSLLR